MLAGGVPISIFFVILIFTVITAFSPEQDDDQA
jgi:hypothetical protein